MAKALKELKEEMTTVVTELRELGKTAEESETKDFDTEQREKATTLLGKLEGIKTQIKEIEGDAVLLKSINDLDGSTEVEDPKDPKKSQTKGSIGTQLAKHVTDELEPLGGNLGEKMTPEGVIAPMQVAGGMKAVLTGLSDTSAGALVMPQDLGLADEGKYARELVLRDLVTNGNTESDNVTYARENAATNAAAPVAEATATGGASGLKPESTFTLERITEPVKNIAHWIPATKRALSDAGQIRTLADNFLKYGLEEELEDQMVLGNGVGENFTGISNVSGVQAQAWDTDLFTTARKAKTKVKTVGKARATAYLFNPEDNERIDLATDGNDRYYGNGPFGIGPDVLWGIRRVESEAVPAGTGYVADWRFAVLWDREEASIVVGTINDQLIRNMVTILAELRAAFGIIRPAAFVEIDLTA